MRPDHPALVALRKAAVAWATASREPARDVKDSAFKRVDRALQRAARRFAELRDPVLFGVSTFYRHHRVALPDGAEAYRVAVKCYHPGCRRVKFGYLTYTDQTGQLLDRQGRKLADLREQDFACSEHGIADGSAPFLQRDSE